jgi:superoxide dismutase, Cu-Zn family
MIRTRVLVVAVVCVAAVGAAAFAGIGTPQDNAQAAARADLKNARGEPVGAVQLTETPAGVLLHGVLTGLPPGPHAFHIHEAGKCDAPDFKTAGGHFNPGSQHHGFASPQGSHAGDLPNLFVPESGKIEFDALAKGVTLGAGATSLFGPSGTALVIHQSGDDYKTDPAGNAGARIACGVISR